MVGVSEFPALSVEKNFKVVVVEIEGVVNVVPVPNEGSPVLFAYQLIIPAEAVAPRLTVPASHLAAGVVPVIDGVVQGRDTAKTVHCVLASSPEGTVTVINLGSEPDTAAGLPTANQIPPLLTYN